MCGGEADAQAGAAARHGGVADGGNQQAGFGEGGEDDRAAWLEQRINGMIGVGDGEIREMFSRRRERRISPSRERIRRKEASAAWASAGGVAVE